MRVVVHSVLTAPGAFPTTGNWTMDLDDPEPGCYTLRGSGPGTCDIVTIDGNTVAVTVDEGGTVEIVVCNGSATVSRV